MLMHVLERHLAILLPLTLSTGWLLTLLEVVTSRAGAHYTLLDTAAVNGPEVRRKMRSKLPKHQLSLRLQDKIRQGAAPTK